MGQNQLLFDLGLPANQLDDMDKIQEHIKKVRIVKIINGRKSPEKNGNCFFFQHYCAAIFSIANEIHDISGVKVFRMKLVHMVHEKN